MMPMQAPVRVLLRPAAAVVLLAACLQTTLAAGLEGQDWQLTGYRTESGLADAAEGGTRAVLRFEGGRLGGSAGCNRLLGSYTSDGGALELAPNMASTMMACPPPLMAQEQAVIQALGQVKSYSITNDELTLTDATGKTLLTFAQLQATPLTGTTWRLTHFNNGKGGVSTTVPGTEFMLMLAEDGRLSGKACNNYRGGFVVSGEDFALEGPLAATKMLCPEPDGANAQESAYFAALERAARYRIRGDELVLTDAEGAVQARFRAAEPGE